MFDLDLAEIFQSDLPVFEIFLRGTVTYLVIFVLMRVVVKQAAGSLNLADLMLVVFIADAAQNGMSGDYDTVTDGLLLVATLVFWSYAIDWLSYHSPLFGRFVHPPPVEIVKDGKKLPRNMRSELITDDELMTHIRLAGGDAISDVKRVWIEGNGRMSVLLKEP
jgi:uncharacterized membrane protein YcaP (DUF421 family)